MIFRAIVFLFLFGMAVATAAGWYTPESWARSILAQIFVANALLVMKS